MRVGWLVDKSDYVGGAELTMEEFKAAAPDGTEFSTDLEPDVDVWVIGNCVTFGYSGIGTLLSAPIVKYVHDAWTWGDKELRSFLLDKALCVFTSPLHRKTFRWNAERWEIVPPAVDTDRFRKTKHRRKPAVHVGHFYWRGKGGHLLGEWAAQNDTKLDVYGQGPFGPASSPWVEHKGPLKYEQVPKVLTRYERFVHLPTGVEPFGRGVVEAHAAGCKVVTNGNVGARYFLEEAPERLETAAADFWRLVVREAS